MGGNGCRKRRSGNVPATPALSLPLALGNQLQKLVAGTVIFAKRTEHHGRHRPGVLFLNPAHHHAEMLRLYHHTDTGSTCHLLHRIRDLLKNCVENTLAGESA